MCSVCQATVTGKTVQKELEMVWPAEFVTVLQKMGVV